jgi:hypothetical protein
MFKVDSPETNLLTNEMVSGQIIRSGIPVAAVMLGAAIQGLVPSGFEVLSLAILTSGVGLSMWEGSVHGGTPQGVALCGAGTLAAAAMLNFSGKVCLFEQAY